MSKLTLLPRKAFEFVLADGTKIDGQYSLWAVKRYTDRKKLSLSGLFTQLTAENLSMDDVCQLILSAVEYTYRKANKPFHFNDMHACEWIEELGGLNGEDFAALLNHAKDEEPAKEDEEKKTEIEAE